MPKPRHPPRKVQVYCRVRAGRSGPLSSFGQSALRPDLGPSNRKEFSEPHPDTARSVWPQKKKKGTRMPMLLGKSKEKKTIEGGVTGGNSTMEGKIACAVSRAVRPETGGWKGVKMEGGLRRFRCTGPVESDFRSSFPPTCSWLEWKPKLYIEINTSADLSAAAHPRISRYSSVT